jgi:magnesium transporter
MERNQVPKIHPYSDHLFVVLHASERGKGGHVHLLELDQFIGPNYLVTVHGPVNPAAPADAALRETRAILKRMQAGRLRPHSSFELSYAIVAAVTRHELLVVRTMPGQSREVYGRMAAALIRLIPVEAQPLVADLGDQLERVRGLADGEKDFLDGVIEFYQTRTDTKMTIAAERLAVIAAVTLPITALSSIYGMNVIVNERTHYLQLTVLLAVMAAMSAALLRWTKQQGWW